MEPSYFISAPPPDILGDGICFDPVLPFSLDASLHCGQAFRWRPCGDGSFTGVVDGEIIRASLEGSRLVLT